MRRLAAAAFAISAVLLSAWPAAAEEQPETKTFAFQQLRAADAATVLRTIVGIRELTASDDHSLEITGEQALVRLATELLSALDALEVVRSQSFATGDDTVIAVIPLSEVSAADAMLSMRKLEIRRIAALDDGPVVVVRDTPDQVALAIDVLDDAASE